MNEFLPRRQLVLLAILCEGGFGLLAWVLGWTLGQPAAASLQWGLADAVWGLAASLPMLAMFIACLRWPIGPFQRIQRACREFIVPLFAPCTLVDLALIALLAGIGEELLFRGVLQGYLTRVLGTAAGLTIASLLFGMLHPLSAPYVVLATTLGAYLGVLWQATGNLLVPIVAHAVYDFVALAVLRLNA